MLATLMPFALSYALIAMLPGPNFAVVAHASLNGCRGSALRAAFGVAAGASLLASVVVGGAGMLVADAPTHRLASIAYGGVLIFIGFRALRRATALRSGIPAGPRTPTGFRLAFLTAVANPASALFFAAAAFGARQSGPEGVFGAALVVFLVAAIWFCAVGLVLSRPSLQLLRGRFGRHADVGLGCALVVFGCIALALPPDVAPL